MEQKKLWLLRPVAWICTIIMMLGLQLVAELICRLGVFLILWLDGLSTVVVAILVLLFGSVFCGLFFYSAVILPSLLVSLSEKIYPSNHAFRYYFVGIYEIIGCVLLILAAIGGLVSGGSMFWFYARYGWLILASIVMMVTGHSEAKERHDQIKREFHQAQSEIDAYKRLLSVLKIGSGAEDIDSAIAMLSDFYLKKGLAIPGELYLNITHLSEQEKCKKLLRILEIGTGVAGIESVTRRLIDFYIAKGITFPDDVL